MISDHLMDTFKKRFRTPQKRFKECLSKKWFIVTLSHDGLKCRVLVYTRSAGMAGVGGAGAGVGAAGGRACVGQQASAP